MPGRVVAWLVVAAFLSWAALPRVKGLLGILEIKQREFAYAEILGLTDAAWRYRRLFGDYGGISIRALNEKGFGLWGVTDGIGENVYGRDMAVRSADARHDRAHVAYGFGDAGDCGLFLRLFAGFDGYMDQECDGEMLRFTLD